MAGVSHPLESGGQLWREYEHDRRIQRRAGLQEKKTEENLHVQLDMPSSEYNLESPLETAETSRLSRWVLTARGSADKSVKCWARRAVWVSH